MTMRLNKQSTLPGTSAMTAGAMVNQTNHMLVGDSKQPAACAQAHRAHTVWTFGLAKMPQQLGLSL